MKSSGAAVFSRRNPFPPPRPAGRSHYHPSPTDNLSKNKRHTSLSPVRPRNSPQKRQAVRPEERHPAGGADGPICAPSTVATEERLPWFFSESWPSTEQSSSPDDTAALMETSTPGAGKPPGSGDQQDSVLAKYVDRFRHGRPRSREERQQSREEQEGQSFWWMRDPSPLPCRPSPTETPKQAAVPEQQHSETCSPVRYRGSPSPPSPCRDIMDFSALGLSDTSHGDLVDPDILQLQERAGRLLLRSEGSVSSESVPMVSSEGLGCSEFSSPGSVEEPARRTFVPTAEPVTAGAPSSASIFHVGHASSAPRPADDILFQWRLRRKMELARHWLPAPSQSPQNPGHWLPAPSQSPQNPGQQQSQSPQNPGQQSSQYPGQQQSQSPQYPGQQRYQNPGQQQSQNPGQQQFQYPGQQQSQNPGQQQSQNPGQQQSQNPGQQQFQYPGQQQSQNPGQQQSQNPGQQQSQNPGQQQPQYSSSEMVRPSSNLPSQAETQETAVTFHWPRPAATPLPPSGVQSDAQVQVQVPPAPHTHLLCDVLPCPGRAPSSTPPRQQLSRRRTECVPPKNSSSSEEEEEEGLGKRGSRPSWPLQCASPPVTTEEEEEELRVERRRAERRRQEKLHSRNKPRTSSTRHADGGRDRDDTGSRKTPARPQRSRGDGGQQGTSRDTYQGTSRVQEDTYQGTSIEDRTGDRAPPSSPIHCALGQVVSEVLFPTRRRRRRSPVSPPPAPPPQSPAPPPPPPPPALLDDLQRPLEVITQLLQEAHDSDETEFEDDPLLQVLRKQRAWVKDQMSEVDSILEEFQQHESRTR